MEWISVKDKLPSDFWKEEFGGDVVNLTDDFLVCIRPDDDDPNDEITVTVYEFHSGKWWYFGGSETPYSDQVTHWMPLPKPPKER